jgi:hypothetical protein
MAAPYYVYGGNLLNREKFTSVVNTAFGQRRYFSSIDTDVYFGDIHIDEMVAFDFIIEEKKLPIFGYNNFTPKRLLTGQKTIQGSFAINFTRTHNMAAILAEVQDSLYANEYEETQFYCSDDNQALFGKGFDITLSYGDHQGEGSYNSCIQTLVGCYITSYRQAFDTSGEPILDMYTFIAKDLLTLAPAEEPVEEKDPTVTDNETSIEPLSPESYFLRNGLDSEDLLDGQNAIEYYEAKKDETPEPLCVTIRPTFTYVDGVYKITAATEVHNEGVTLENVAISISINAPSLGINSVKYNLGIDKDNGALGGYYSHTMKGTDVSIGQKISEYLKDEPYIECDINMVCIASQNSGTVAKHVDFNMNTHNNPSKLYKAITLNYTNPKGNN